MYEPTKEIAEEQYARLKAASPTEWAQGYSVAFTMKKASEYLRASLCMPQSLFSSATDCERLASFSCFSVLYVMYECYVFLFVPLHPFLSMTAVHPLTNRVVLKKFDSRYILCRARKHTDWPCWFRWKGSRSDSLKRSRVIRRGHWLPSV